jgi:hypothetical protein
MVTKKSVFNLAPHEVFKHEIRKDIRIYGLNIRTHPKVLFRTQQKFDVDSPKGSFLYLDTVPVDEDADG